MHRPHQFNYEEAMERLLPPLLRKPKQLAWLKTLLSPLAQLESEWKSLHHEVLGSYEHRHQVGVLQGYLRKTLAPNDSISLQNLTGNRLEVCWPAHLNTAENQARLEALLKPYAPLGLRLEYKTG